MSVLSSSLWNRQSHFKFATLLDLSSLFRVMVKKFKNNGEKKSLNSIRPVLFRRDEVRAVRRKKAAEMGNVGDGRGPGSGTRRGEVGRRRRGRPRPGGGGAGPGEAPRRRREAAGAAGTRTVPGPGAAGGGREAPGARPGGCGPGWGVRAGPSRGCHVVLLGVPPRLRAPSALGDAVAAPVNAGDGGGWEAPGSWMLRPPAAPGPAAAPRPSRTGQGAPCPGPLPAGSARRPVAENEGAAPVTAPWDRLPPPGR